MDCLDDNTVNAYIQHVLPAATRARVAAHLDHCEACLQIICAAARSTGELAETVADAAPRAPTAGEVIGRYALVSMIGRGAMGAVYVAHDPRLDREIALKIVRSARFAEREVRARLSREARAMAKVRHPHVAAVYDAGELDDGVFIAMELVDGETLTRWQAARGWRDCLQMYLAAGHGLAAAHAAGVVHRDFKPDNVLVDRAGRAVVTDFGLAMAPLALGSAPAASPVLESIEPEDLTRTGTLMGTPRYMSPEQFACGVVDARSDQFSFAVALFEALHGCPPFAGGTVTELRMAVMAGALRARPASAELPARLHRALVRALATRAEDRYPTMTALLEALAAAARPAGRRLAWLAALVIAVGGAGAAVLAARPSAHAVRPPDAPRVVPPRRLGVFVQPFANATGDPRLDDTLDVVVADVLSRSTQLDAAAGAELAAAAAALGGTPSDVDGLLVKLREQDDRPMVTVHGAIRRAADGYEVTLDAAPAGRARFTASERAVPADLIAAATRLGARLRVELGDPPAAGSLDHVLSRSLDAMHAFVQGQQRVLAGDPAGAIDRYRAALAADPELVEARSSLGLTLYNTSDLTGAVAELERALRNLDHMSERARLMLLGDYYGSIGKYSAAISAYEQLLSRWPGDLRAVINLTATALDSADWPLALQLARRAARDVNDLDVIRANLIMAELGSTRLDEAARDGARMLAELPHPTASGFTFVAITAALTGRLADAHAIYDRLAALDPGAADLGRADLAIYEGKLDDAERLLLHAITPALARDAAGEVAPALLHLARLRLRRGDHAGAARAATQAMGHGVARVEYMAASLALEAGQRDGIDAKIAAWSAHVVADWRAYSVLLAGDLARAQRRPREAIARYREAAQLGVTWLAHDRLARAHAAAGAPADAERELAWCLEHRGEGTLYLSPSLSYVADVELGLARSRDAQRDAAGAIAAYRALAAHAPAAQHDPWTDEARRHLPP